MGAVAEELVSKLKAAALSKDFLEHRTHTRERRKPFQAGSGAKFDKVTRRKAVAIGISTGGPATLQEVLPLIPADVPAVFFWCSICRPPSLPRLRNASTIIARSRSWRRAPACR